MGNDLKWNEELFKKLKTSTNATFSIARGGSPKEDMCFLKQTDALVITVCLRTRGNTHIAARPRLGWNIRLVVRLSILCQNRYLSKEIPKAGLCFRFEIYSRRLLPALQALERTLSESPCLIFANACINAKIRAGYLFTCYEPLNSPEHLKSTENVSRSSP